MTGFARKNIEKKLGWSIEFQHILTGRRVGFQAFVTDYSDTYTQEWSTQNVYGRMDPLLNFGGTQRKITFAWDVVSGDYKEAKANLAKMELLAKMMYPTYTVNRQGKATQTAGADIETKGAAIHTINGAPLMRVRFTNLLKDANTGKIGLLGALQEGISFKPVLDAGFVTKGPGEAIPKIYSLNASLTVLHEHELGWAGGDGAGEWLGADTFPYGLGAGTTPDRSGEYNMEWEAQYAQYKSYFDQTPAAGGTSAQAPMSVTSEDVNSLPGEGGVTTAPNASTEVEGE